MLRVVLLCRAAFPSSSSLSLRSASSIPVPQHSWCRATRGMTNLSISEFDLFVLTASVFRLSLSVLAISSAVRIRRPRHLLRLGPLPAGRLSTSELVGAWGKAPRSNLAISCGCASVSVVIDRVVAMRPRSNWRLRVLLKADCHAILGQTFPDLRKSCSRTGVAGTISGSGLAGIASLTASRVYLVATLPLSRRF